MPEFSFLDSPGFVPPMDYLHQIFSLYHREGWWDGPENHEHLLKIIQGSHCFMIVTESTRIIGMGRALSDGVSDAYIQDVTVEKNCRGKGLGTQIIQRLARRLNQDGIYWIGLIAERGSKKFYERIGFKTMADSTPMLKHKIL